MTDLLVERRGTTAWVTLNRPDARNAMSRALNVQLADLAPDLDVDDDVRAVVITGAGDKAFSAGADLKERRGLSPEEAGQYVTVIGRAITAWADMRKPTICAMNGSAYGGGLELALACDFRILVEGAELALTEVKLGIMPGGGGTQRLPRLIGEARAKELILLGRRIGSARALEIGLVHQVVPRAGFDAAVQALLAELATCAPLSVRAAKAAIERGYGKPISEGLDIERECYDATLFSEDRNEGLAAFAEGRPPKYIGH
jgi:enoyl-CoA hydratase/carnithine racemase